MTDPQKPPTLWQVIASVSASFFGVQSSKNRERDFKHGKAAHFIVIGLLATGVFVDLGELETGCDRLEQSENLAAADHRKITVSGEHERFLKRMGDFGAFGRPMGIARQHDMAAAAKQPRQALEGFAPHYHRSTQGQPLEALEVARDPPRHLAAARDRTITRAGNDKGNVPSAHSRSSRVTWPILRPSRASALP